MSDAEAPLRIGMACPECGHSSSEVKDSRPAPRGRIRRRRQCHHCQAKYTTYEVASRDVAHIDIARAALTKLQIAMGGMWAVLNQANTEMDAVDEEPTLDAE